jgi:hypothetical protein
MAFTIETVVYRSRRTFLGPSAATAWSLALPFLGPLTVPRTWFGNSGLRRPQALNFHTNGRVQRYVPGLTCRSKAGSKFRIPQLSLKILVKIRSSFHSQFLVLFPQETGGIRSYPTPLSDTVKQKGATTKKHLPGSLDAGKVSDCLTGRPSLLPIDSDDKQALLVRAIVSP